MSREAVMKKRGFNDLQYRRFATAVGHRINFNKKMRMLAEHFEVSIFDLGYVVRTSLKSEVSEVVNLILELRTLANPEDDSSLPGIISREISQTTRKSFERFGDRNCLSKEIIRNYIHEEGMPLDTQCDILNETYPMGFEIQDFVDFILSYPDGPETYKSGFDIRREEITEELVGRLGFRICDRVAMAFYTEFFEENEVENNPPF